MTKNGHIMTTLKKYFAIKIHSIYLKVMGNPSPSYISFVRSEFKKFNKDRKRLVKICEWFANYGDLNFHLGLKDQILPQRSKVKVTL